MSQSDRAGETYMTVSQAAKILGWSPPTMRRRFDEAFPESGRRLEPGKGRTGSGERKVSASWVYALKGRRGGTADHGA